MTINQRADELVALKSWVTFSITVATVTTTAFCTLSIADLSHLKVAGVVDPYLFYFAPHVVYCCIFFFLIILICLGSFFAHGQNSN